MAASASISVDPTTIQIQAGGRASARSPCSTRATPLASTPWTSAVSIPLDQVGPAANGIFPGIERQRSLIFTRLKFSFSHIQGIDPGSEPARLN